MALGALLEDRRLLERPRGRACLLPVLVLPNRLGNLAEIGLVVRSEIEPGPLSGHRGGGGEEFGFHDAILVMASFGPWIRKEDENCGEAGIFREGRKEIVGIGTDKMQVVEARPLALAIGPRNAVGRDIDAHAAFTRMRRGIGRQKVPMPTTDLPDEA